MINSDFVDKDKRWRLRTLTPLDNIKASYAKKKKIEGFYSIEVQASLKLK